jgi:hypothetical protein
MHIGHLRSAAQNLFGGGGVGLFDTMPEVVAL